MKVSVFKLNEVNPALNAIGNTKLPPKIAYRIGKTMNHISSAMKQTEDYRINLLTKMGKLNEAKTSYDFDPPEKKEEFQKMFDEYQQREIEVNFPLFTLVDIANIQIEPVVLGMLEKVGAVSELEVVEEGAKQHEKKH
jgi:hypothetical protein